MTRYADMLIDTPYRLIDIEDRRHRTGPAPAMCTYCKRLDERELQEQEEITVIRRWTVRSVYVADGEGFDNGGRWEWRCHRHPYNGDSSTAASNAPPHLQRAQPPMRCEDVTLRQRCKQLTVERYENRWLCKDHSESIVERLRVEERLAELDGHIAGA